MPARLSAAIPAGRAIGAMMAPLRRVAMMPPRLSGAAGRRAMGPA
jgi:hypothetical protein